jgi:YggT family protein
MAAPLVFIVYAILQFLFVTAFLLRLLLPLLRANMRNPISQAVLRATNPLVMPLRRVLPPIGRLDTATVIALLAVQFLTVVIIALLAGLPMEWGFLLRVTVSELIKGLLSLYMVALLLYVVISWLAPHSYSPAGDLLNSLCESILKPIRRVIPPLAGLDFSAFFALIGIYALKMVLQMALPIGVFPFN